MAVELLVRVGKTQVQPSVWSPSIVPATPGDYEILDGIRPDIDFLAKLTRASRRSVQQNKFYWELLRSVIENQEFYRSASQLHFWLKIKLGYVEQIEFHNNQMITRVKSTSFENMDSDDFKQYLDSSIMLICEEIIPNMQRRDLVNKVESMLKLSYDALWQGKIAA